MTTTATTTITELLQSANSHLFDSESARYPDDDLTVWTPRAFSTSDSMMVVEAGGLDCALSATAEQSEPRTPFAWGDYERTLREGETQVRLWVEDVGVQTQGDEEEQEAPEAEYKCRPEATPRPPPSPIGDYAVVADAAPAPEEEPVPEEAPAMEEAAPVRPKKVRVYFSGKRMWSGAAPSKRARRAAKKAPTPLRVKLPMGEDATLARGARWCAGWRGARRRSGTA